VLPILVTLTALGVRGVVPDSWGGWAAGAPTALPVSFVVSLSIYMYLCTCVCVCVCVRTVCVCLYVLVCVVCVCVCVCVCDSCG
jgi:hypothetical protein